MIFGLHLVHQNLIQCLAKHGPKQPKLVVPPAEAIRLCALGYDQLLADWYWLTFVQYVGDTDGRARDGFADADRYLDIIVGLDPHFIKAYWFAAFIVGSEQHNPKRAQHFIDRGIDANVDNWYLPFIAGINQYLNAHDEVAAAKYYRMAAKYPDAPKWVGRQADALEARIPSLFKQINTWANVFNLTEDVMIKEKARLILIDLNRKVLNSPAAAPAKSKARAMLAQLEAPDE